MKRMRVLWAGALLLLPGLSGCSNDKTIQGGGVYSPVITGVSSDPEPAVRNEANQLTVLVTNVNNYPLTYHWSTSHGVLTDSTHQTAVWDAPDTIGTFPVTCAVVATGDDATFYKATTFQIFVDNKFVRWTKSDAVQFDPAPMGLGGVIFAQYRSITAQTSDIYSVPAVGVTPVQLTQGIYTAVSPTMRADGQQIAFAGRLTSIDSVMIWSLPGTGGDASAAANVVARTTNNRILGTPRFAPTGTRLLYSSDSSSVGNPRPWYVDAFNLPVPQNGYARVIALNQAGTNSFYGANWGGPDGNADGIPDSVVTQSQRGFGSPGQLSRGLFKLATSPPQTVVNQWLADSSATDPDWSTDGGYIIYAKTNPPSIASPIAERDIWIIRADATDKSQAIRVTFGPADDSHPRFSDDGSTIYFVSNRADRYGLSGVFPTERRGTNIWSVSDFDLP